VASVLVAAEQRFSASLGTIPGAYLQVDEGLGIAETRTNRWEFTADGRFHAYYDGDLEDPMYDGTYRVDAGRVFLHYRILILNKWESRQLAIITNGLEDRNYSLVKLRERK
jgi:hypothetical protein